MSAPDPWEIVEHPVMTTAGEWDLEDAAIDAIARGLRSLGYAGICGSEDTTPEWSWPDWARAVYYALAGCGLSDAGEVAVVHTVAEWPEADRDALVAADALGGSGAVRQMLGALIPPVVGFDQPKE